jgi:hypothetical protein
VDTLTHFLFLNVYGFVGLRNAEASFAPLGAVKLMHLSVKLNTNGK